MQSSVHDDDWVFKILFITWSRGNSQAHPNWTCEGFFFAFSPSWRDSTSAVLEVSNFLNAGKCKMYFMRYLMELMGEINNNNINKKRVLSKLKVLQG